MVKFIYVKLRGELGVHKQFIGYFLKLFSVISMVFSRFLGPLFCLLARKRGLHLLHCGVYLAQLHGEPSDRKTGEKSMRLGQSSFS